ncbi:MAG: TonB-dependent receptor plug domain-containing protein, partial [Candidatus Competibacterales bacterium]|nr:TonB-dependent receptor plug domain-containing protein [Candidatus Competibacterales bacterium]
MYSALLAPAVVFAQDDAEVYEETIPLQEEQLEASDEDGDAVSLSKIAVTGSRIKRTDYETANPILTVDRDMIERSGVTSLGDLLQDLPVAGGALGKGFNNGGTGAIEIDLRNLGSQRVLVLVNGRRWVNGLRSLSTSSVDLTTIPVSIVERIDVLKDGASTTYGSDAIAGVVNIITRDDFDGLELRGQYGQFDEGDGETQGLTASWGRVFGQTSVFVDLNYADEGEVFAGDRAISRVPTFGTGNSRGSLGTPQGTFVWVPDPAQTDPTLLQNECDRLDVAAGTIEGETGIGLPLPEELNQLPLCFLTLRDGMDGTQQSHFRRFDPIN